MNILITGGAGFVGSSIAIQLKKAYPHYHIIAFDNLKRRGSELNLADLRDHDIAFIHGDIRNPEDLAVLPPFEIMIEASAEPSVMSGLDGDPTYVINNNLVGSIHCFNVCIKNKAKIIFLSTSRVYPIAIIESALYTEEETRFNFVAGQIIPGISERGISETLSLNGARSFYGTTKLCGEHFIQEYAAFYGIEASVIRFGVIAGPRQMGKTDQGVVTLWMAKHYWKQSLKYIGYGGTGKQVRDLLHIDDVTDLVDHQIHHFDVFKNKVFNAGGGRDCSGSLQEMTAICQDITGNTISIGSDPVNRPADLRIYISDITKIEEKTGWKPKKSVQNIFEDIFTWISHNEQTLEKILK